MSDINPFSYTAGPADFNLRLVKQNKHWRHYLVDFPVVSANHYPGAETALGEYFEPTRKNNVPLAILIHGWGDHSVLPFKWMAGRTDTKRHGLFYSLSAFSQQPTAG